MREGASEEENDRVARTMRSGRGHDGVMSASVGLARAGVVGRGDIGRATRGKGRHKGVDKVAIAYGTQLHAPALPPANPLPSPGSHPRSTTPSALSRPRVVQPSAPRGGARSSSSLLNPLPRTTPAIPVRSSRHRALLWGSLKGRLRSIRSGKSARQPDGNAAPVASSSRWMLPPISGVTLPRALARDPTPAHPPLASSLLQPLALRSVRFSSSLSLSLSLSRSPHHRQPTMRLNRTVPRRFRWVH